MNIGDHKEALERLMKGNERFVKGRAIQPNGSPEHRRELLAGQEPFAVVLGCSDSRVPPEIIFDCGLGEIFVIRVAGNILDDVVIGSIEYAVEHLGTRLVLVLGHESCGAVGASLEGGEAGGHIDSIVNAIVPAVESVRAQKGDLYENAIKANSCAMLRISRLRTQM